MATAAVLYHYPCPDGAFAALAAYLYFSALRKPVRFYPNIVYNPIKIEDLPFSDFEAVYLLDMVGPDGFVKDLSLKAKRVVILDHHLTAVKRFKADEYAFQNIHCIIDMRRSAATVAYDYFTEKLQSEKKLLLVAKKDKQRVHTLFKYVEDADLWRWSLFDSKAFSTGLKKMKIEMSAVKNTGLFQQLLKLNPRQLIEKGRRAMSETSKMITTLIENSFPIRLGHGRFGQCLALEVDKYIANHRSELGHALASKSCSLNMRPIGAIAYSVQEIGNDKLKVSLRSLGAEDTAKISEAYKGGGHLNASSFLIGRDEFEQWKV
eukprot:TRINITY_DN5730_c0_g1_i1.p1 TRINITY_DN5730_c0_g1~~TRINITY_DN5730_c0_g1_i1.p1  ORF type:complete len:320 (+),score=60.88 TRINITY_DN5730_c0_g1_i1:202-1161(+)